MFQDIAQGSSFQCADSVSNVRVHGEEDDFDILIGLFDLAYRLNAIQKRHRYICNNNVRLKFFCCSNKCAAIFNNSDKLKFRLKQAA